MMETDTLEFESLEDVTDVEHSGIFQRGQRSLGLREEPLSKRFVAFKLIAFLPPGSDSILRITKMVCRRQAVTLFPLIHLAMSRHQVPKMITGPSGPWKAVVNIQGALSKWLSRPHAFELAYA